MNNRIDEEISMNQNKDIIQQKHARLKNLLQEMGSCLIALSGGVDSVFLMRVAHEVLGQKAVGVTCDSPSMPREELESAIQLSKEIGFRHRIVETHEIEQEDYAANPSNRCYFCRQVMFHTLKKIALEENCPVICDGYNYSDQRDYRPGRQAAKEHDVRSPLYEAELTKAEVRVLSHEYGLPNWDRPAAACLSSRIPYGSRVTVDKLRQIEESETYLRSLGLRQVRVRHHGEVARIETNPKEFSLLLAGENPEKITSRLKEIGFLFVTLDLLGYRTGSLNEEL